MNIMDYPSERICEALGWLYGGEWKHNMEAGEKSAFTNEFNDRVGLDIEDGLCMWRGWFKRNIEDDLTHALEVTEPWEWKREKTGHLTYNGVVIAGLYPKGTQGIPWWWWLGTTKHEDTAPDVESAKTAARAAYLRWMRGGLAIEGLPKEPTPCPDCEGTGWSYHENLPVERHIGCNSCGGCGDKRGTGVTP